MRKSDLDRFWKKIVIPADSSDCWIWTAAKNWDGYGTFTLSGKDVRAHRVSWFIRHGQWPGSACVLHSCDTRACCNPSHLFLGTRGDNAKDRDRKGRLPKGEDHTISKLTAEQALNIYKRAWAGENSASIAAEYKISRATPLDVKHGRTWSHITGHTNSACNK